MAEFKIALQRTLVHEGGYSNDPDDQGGETYKGISRTRHDEWAGWAMIDRYKLKAGFLTSLNNDSRLQAEVEQFYRISFWDPLHGEQIRDQSVADSIFDFGVNAGVKTSVRLAQWVAGTVADGVIGEKTLEKLNASPPAQFRIAFTLAKIDYYISIIKKRPANKKYLFGWISRVLDFYDSNSVP
ncbi:MAG: glycosyl hydrolase 108 family protein [Bacteroidota bacterium]|nr:glycosyl hydrolase 108 family protein [Bacteroidota bacterium]